MINRALSHILESKAFQGKLLLVTGPRQVGKTTLVRGLAEKLDGNYLWLSGDEPDVRQMLERASSTRMKAIFGSHKLVVIDEAQLISDIGITLKIAIDSIPGIQIIATGSSALELANKIQEPLTGRKWHFQLYPLAFGEMVNHTTFLEEKRMLEHRLVFGYYPEVVIRQAEEEAQLREITNSYLYKDLLSLGTIFKPSLLQNLLKALAFQVGQEVTYHELAQLLGANQVTIERYIDLLEQVFVIFRLTSLSRNLRNEIKRGRKIYFYDNGIRNALISNLNPIGLRDDIGPLWENWFVSERMKWLHYTRKHVNTYFWRTHTQTEIDYIEEGNGFLNPFEIKWNPKVKAKWPKTFMDAYPVNNPEIVNRENYDEFLLPLMPNN